MIRPGHLRAIIRLSLGAISRYSPAAEEILLMIAAHESNMGRFPQQIGGPALGIYGMEPDTESDIWITYLAYRPELVRKIIAICAVTGPNRAALRDNPLYATIMARLKLWRAPRPLPPPDDIAAMSLYAKQHYNSRLGKATPEKYAADYARLVLA